MTGREPKSDSRHWERMYSSRSVEQLGWYRENLETSFNWINSLGMHRHAAIIDVGSGASTLVDDLITAGYRKVTAVDLSESALKITQSRLGDKAGLVTWLVGDLVEIDLPTDEYALWHDRAVFHFLVDENKRQKYLDRMTASLKAGGRILIGTFSLEAPRRCSGLPVQRYDTESLAAVFGSQFHLERSQNELHVTPGGTEQMYLYALFSKA